MGPVGELAESPALMELKGSPLPHSGGFTVTLPIIKGSICSQHQGLLPIGSHRGDNDRLYKNACEGISAVEEIEALRGM